MKIVQCVLWNSIPTVSWEDKLTLNFCLCLNCIHILAMLLLDLHLVKKISLRLPEGTCSTSTVCQLYKSNLLSWGCVSSEMMTQNRLSYGNDHFIHFSVSGWKEVKNFMRRTVNCSRTCCIQGLNFVWHCDGYANLYKVEEVFTIVFAKYCNRRCCPSRTAWR